MEDRIDLSVVITVHNEGLVAHKTMRSVFEAVQKAEEAGYVLEIIIHIDNGDKKTVDYFARYKNEDKIRVFKNSFGDLGLSRNFANKKARGGYVTFLDGDDLISSNWYIAALKVLEEAEVETVVHPEAILTFGNGENILTLQLDSGLNARLALIGDNCWCSVVMGKKEIFKKYPYCKMGKGYSFEDYKFNVDTLADGVQHKVASGTVLFYRRSENSMLSQGNRDHAVLPYSRLLDFVNFKDFDFGEKENLKKNLKEKSYVIYKKIRGNDKLNYFITPVAKTVLKIINHNHKSNENEKIPKYVLEEWEKINHIDSELYPYDYLVKRVKFYSAHENLDMGRVYSKIARGVTKIPDYVFIVPWVMRGGADKVLFNYIEALKEIHKDWHFAVITTLSSKNVWAKDLPTYVDCVDFGNLVASLSPEKQEIVFSKMIIQLKCKKIHIINSEYGYNWAKRHLTLLKNNYDLYVSIFAWGYIEGSNLRAIYSYDNPCLFSIYSVVKKIFTDNMAMKKYMIDKNGFDGDKIEVHYQPIRELKLNSVKEELVNGHKLKILWAGRIAQEKLPGLVGTIGKKIDTGMATIDVYGEIEKNVDAKMFNDITALKYCGPYDGFDSLPIEEYDVLLYTSLNDGIPNVILEATAAGLPIIASNDGGVGEFIENGKTGILIEDYLDYEPYIMAIRDALKKPKRLQMYAKNAQQVLRERHSWKRFIDIVKRDID